MGILRAFIAFAASLALAACAPVGAQPVQNSPVAITLTRTVCFGFCPDYTVTLTGDGRVTYVGRNFVNVVGERTATIPRADVERLLARFDAVHFETLRDAYRGQMTDLPTYTITLERNGRRKSVIDYGGVSAGMPAAVRELQDEIDRVTGTAQWVRRNGEPVRDLPPH